MRPKEVLSVDEIRLGDPEFWRRPIDEREGAFLTLRRERPISFQEDLDDRIFTPGTGFYALTRHADILEVGRNARTFCSGKGATAIQDLAPEFEESFGAMMIAMDHPRHGRLRRLVSSSFTPKQIARIERDVDVAAAEALDAVIERGECDFVSAIAAPFPIRIICDMMGIPRSQHEFVFEMTNIIMSGGDPEYFADGVDLAAQVADAGKQLALLMGELGKERLANPTEDLTSALVHAEIEGEKLTNQEIVSFFVLLTNAGNETTRTAISHGMKAFCEFPDERCAWQEDFDAVAPTAVEEIVRWASPVIFMRRTATCSGELSGQKFEEGDKFVMYYPSGNRDEAVFDDPFRFDVRRKENDHVGYGGGPHFCLGAFLARREIKVIFREIFERMPDLEITAEPDWLWSSFVNGIKRMPCRWTPGPRTGAAFA